MTEYNGWTNWETWCVNLWLDNEYGYAGLEETIAGDTNRYAAGDMLKEYAEQIVYGDDDAPASLATDLVNGSLSEVNWEEIADSVRDMSGKPWDSEEVLG